MCKTPANHSQAEGLYSVCEWNKFCSSESPCLPNASHTKFQHQNSAEGGVAPAGAKVTGRGY